MHSLDAVLLPTGLRQTQLATVAAEDTGSSF